MSAPTHHGHVKRYDGNRGFGFITRADGAGDIFFHVSQVVAMEEPQPGQRVIFRLGVSRDGRPQAQHVAPAE
jgi:CspA family cold shock protein